MKAILTVAWEVDGFAFDRDIEMEVEPLSEADGEVPSTLALDVVGRAVASSMGSSSWEWTLPDPVAIAGEVVGEADDDHP